MQEDEPFWVRLLLYIPFDKAHNLFGQERAVHPVAPLSHDLPAAGQVKSKGRVSLQTVDDHILISLRVQRCRQREKSRFPTPFR